MTKLEALRRRRGFTQEELAELAGVSAAAVSRIERALVRPRRHTLVHLARELGVRPRRLRELWEADRAEAVLADHDAAEEVSA